MKVIVFIFTVFFGSLSFAQSHTGHWSLPVSVTTDPAEGILHLFFADTSTGYLCTIHRRPLGMSPVYHWYRTINGGNTWLRIVFNNINQWDTNEIAQVQYSTPTPNSIFLARGYPLNKILFSLDKGNNWDTVSNPKIDLDQYFGMITESLGYAIGRNSNVPMILQTTTGPKGFNKFIGNSLFSAVMTNNSFNSTFFTPAGEFTNASHACLIVADKKSNAGKGLTSLVSSNQGYEWEKYSTIFPDYISDTLYGDLRFQKGTLNAWQFPHRRRDEDNFNGIWTAAYLFNHPSFNISYCFTSDGGKSWSYDTSFYDRLSNIYGASPGNVWMLLFNRSIDDYDSLTPPANVIAHTLDYGKSWDVDSKSLNLPDLGLFNGRRLCFTDPNHGWIAALQNGKVFTFSYKPDPLSEVRIEHSEKKKLLRVKHQVFPNPCVNSTTITCPQNTQLQKLELFNLFGRQTVVPYTIINNIIDLDTQELQSGVWLALITHSGGYSATRFIVQK
ncbi:MAG TPA: T9SS type A sorting domain-containing protein [Candidatus Kapabacteria bacterium]|nr:T9SS type A sorting domain-containing protein [Candidatus Kapabacteria bacterium]